LITSDTSRSNHLWKNILRHIQMCTSLICYMLLKLVKMTIHVNLFHAKGLKVQSPLDCEDCFLEDDQLGHQETEQCWWQRVSQARTKEWAGALSN
jgi:hypothetical protein